MIFTYIILVNIPLSIDHCHIRSINQTRHYNSHHSYFSAPWQATAARNYGMNKLQDVRACQSHSCGKPYQDTNTRPCLQTLSVATLIQRCDFSTYANDAFSGTTCLHHIVQTTWHVETDRSLRISQVQQTLGDNAQLRHVDSNRYIDADQK